MGFQGGQSGRGGYDRGPREMHKAICADCKKECEVPFKPREDRPVYCKECFAKRKAGGGSGSAPGKSYPILTPVEMPSHTMNKPPVPVVQPAVSSVSGKPKKTKKNQPAKKAKKKK